MDIRIAVEMLRSLSQRRVASPYGRLAVRVASQWIKQAAIKPSPDVNDLCYAQVLNGALDLASGPASFRARWSATKRQVVTGQQDGKWTALSPKWLDPKQHDIYSPVYKAIMATPGISSESKSDILMLVLTGVGTGTEEIDGETMATLRSGPYFHQAGKQYSGKVQDGTSAPDSTTNSVVGSVVVKAKNAVMDLHRYSQRRPTKDVETDEDYGGDSHYSPNQTLEANEAIKEVLSRLFNANDPEYMFMFFSGLADATGSDRSKLLDKAESAFRNNSSLASVKLKDKSRGLDMMLAYLDLIRSGNEKPLFKDIATVMSRQRVSPEVQAVREEAPPHNNDWTKAKEIAFSGLARVWKGDREVQAILSSFIAKNYNILSI